MFLGTHQYNIDEKGRLTIPAKFRRPLQDGMVITRGLDGNLMIYPIEEWHKLVERIRQLPFGDPSARNFRRLVFSGASDVEMDKQGRVNIVSYLLDFAQITKEVFVVGVQDWIELWSPDRWQPVEDELDNSENASRLASYLGI